MNTTTPTAASLLIDALQPAHRAILFSALEMYIHENNLERIHAENTSAMEPTIQKLMCNSFGYCITEAEQIKKQLFAECFPEDLNIFPFINQAVRANKN